MALDPEPEVDFLAFHPPELATQLYAAVSALNKLGVAVHPFEISEHYPDRFIDCFKSGPEQPVTASTAIELFTTRYDSRDQYSETRSVGYVLQLADELGSLTMWDRSTCATDTRACTYLRPISRQAHLLVEHSLDAEELRSNVDLGGRHVTAHLEFGFNQFGVAIQKYGHHHEFAGPPFLVSDVFAVVEAEGRLSKEDAKRALDAFLFELACGHGLAFGQRYFESWDDFQAAEEAAIEEAEQLAGQLRTVRPVEAHGRLSELQGLFLEAATTELVDFAIVGFVRVLEFVSGPFLRKASHDKIIQLLEGPGVSTPSAALVDAFVDVGRREAKLRMNDSNALAETVVGLVPGPALVPHVPPYLVRRLANIDVRHVKGQEKALRAIAAAFSATRNEAVHAKANYNKTGYECPTEERDQLLRCLRVAAIHAVRWYFRQPPSAR